MNDQPNAPLVTGPDDAAGMAGWFSTWITAVTKPSEQTYAALAEHPDARSNSRAFTWIFLAGTASALISGVLQAILELAGFPSQTPSWGDLFGGNAGQGGMISLGVAICASPIAGAIATLFFAIGVGIVQWIAGLFKGTGTYSQLAYTLAAISVPVSLVSSILTPLSSVQFVNLCAGLISLIVGLYALVLQVMAVKAVNRFGWGEAIGSVLLPGVALACCAVVVIVGLAALGASVSNTFDSIQQSLP
ncbi:MAG TPA: YIP1 family protein [Anaerolineales bacterium]|nr:YIP1 family protein [Anaerolineales bacterium]